MFLQSFVTPIFTYETGEDGRPKAINLKGTGCFLASGVLITAAHVLDNAAADVENKVAEGVCAYPKVPLGEDELNLFIDIKRYDRAPAPYDIAVAATSFDLPSPRKLAAVSASIADDVATLGYPESAYQMHQGTLYVQARAHRGYIQRVIEKDRRVVGENNPQTFELSFAITRGMSGSPLLYNSGGHEFIIGVCVGSHTSRLIDYSLTEVDDAGHRFTEEHSKVEEYGLAHDLRGLLGWHPGVLAGRSLGEIAP